MKLNATKRKRLRHALNCAIGWNEGLIDAHTIELRADLQRHIPKCYVVMCRRMQNEISQWRALLVELEEPWPLAK